MKRYRGAFKHREAHPKIWIWSHTEEAEINYFQEFKNNLRTPLLMPGKFVCYTPLQLIEKAIEWKAGNINDKDGDRVWCIFDVDDFYKNEPAGLLDCIKKAHENGIKIAFANECFEHWILFHFERIGTSLARGSEIEKRIRLAFKKKGLGFYKKNQDVFDVLLPFHEAALNNAKRTMPLSYEEIDWANMLGEGGNPSTSFHFLIEEIHELIGNPLLYR